MPELRSACPIAAALEILGDRWSLLVLRDALLFGKTTFQEFEASPEKISSNTLAERLRRMERCGVLLRERYSVRPPRYRYRPTAAGLALLPLLREAVLWGARHVPGTYQPRPEDLAGMERAIAALRSPRR